MWTVSANGPGAAAGAAPVIAHHRVAVGELLHERGKPAGVGWYTWDHEEQRS